MPPKKKVSVNKKVELDINYERIAAYEKALSIDIEMLEEQIRHQFEAINFETKKLKSLQKQLKIVTTQYNYNKEIFRI